MADSIGVRAHDEVVGLVTRNCYLQKPQLQNSPRSFQDPRV